MLGGEYTGKWRNVKKTLEVVKSVISISDYMHIERMLTSGCPYELNCEESTESKLKIMDRSNQKVLFSAYSDQAAKRINKEEKNTHIFPSH